jgi:adhesin transport system outer membrane protein
VTDIENVTFKKSRRITKAVLSINSSSIITRSKVRHCLALGVFLLLAPLKPVGAITLADAVQQGLANHPEVKSAMAKVDQATTEVDIAEAGYYPKLEASVGPTQSMRSNLGFNYNIIATQMLYDWGRVESQVDSASATLRQQTESLLIMREDAALDISEIYLDVLAYERRVEVVRSHIERLEELNRLTQQRSDAGYQDRSEQGRPGIG